MQDGDEGGAVTWFRFAELIDEMARERRIGSRLHGVLSPAFCARLDTTDARRNDSQSQR